MNGTKQKLGAREAGLLTLTRVEEDGAFVNLALAQVLDRHSLEPRDRKLATQLAYGVITYRLALDWLISQAAGRPVGKIDKHIVNILRLGFYQLFYLDRIPAAAACHTTVELVKKGKKKGLAPFVNGVMRGALRKKNQLPWPDRDKDEAVFLSLMYSHPLWLVTRWIARLGSTETEALLAANNKPALPSARTNTLKLTREELLVRLAEEGVQAGISELVPEGVLPEANGRLSALEAYRRGYLHVQGESAMLTARILDPQPGDRVLDGCSAPGGKTTHLAQLMDNQGEIIALDIFPHRIKLVEANCRRLGVRNVRTTCLDVREATAAQLGTFYRILLDVPCSGFGVIRNKPDLKWRRKEEDILALAGVQKEILRSSAALLRPGGTMVYSTCTNEPEETDAVITWFLANNPGFSVNNPSLKLPDTRGQGPLGVHLYPHIHGVDGFYICSMTRTKE
jgi:16S rRNA (cytosine967-C5)-methyltransferase